MLERDSKKKRGVWRAPPERQQFGGHLLYRKENVVHTSEAPEGTALLRNDTHGDNKQSTRKRGGQILNTLLQAQK